jgi:bisphosphoglycerate-dependent phosphoglycerate mutase
MFDQSTKGKFLYIRHGETDYNVKLNSTKNVKEVQVDETFLDSSLCDDGIKQAEGLGEKLKTLNIKYVFCSPLNRCLETTFISLKDHPFKENITILIHTYITEVIHGAQDLSKNIWKKKELYNENSEIKCDWRHFDCDFPNEKDSEFYFLNFINNIEENDDDIKLII